jgi:hypothetical protein
MILFLIVVVNATQSEAQIRGSLEARLADATRVYEAGENVFVDVILHVEAEAVTYVNFCVETAAIIVGGTVQFSPEVDGRWHGCKLLIPRAGGIAENSLGPGAGVCDSRLPLGVIDGQIQLGQVILRVTADEEIPTTAEVRIGVCNASPEHEAYCHVGQNVLDPVQVMLESAEPVIIQILRPPFIRGDANRDDQVDIADAIYIIQELFGTQNRGWPCPNSGDANEDDSLNISDGIYLINFLFLGTAPPPWPFPEKGYDPDPTRFEWSGCDALS